MVEIAQLPLDARGVGVAALFLVQLRCFQPHDAGLLILAEGDMRVAEGIEGVGGVVGVAQWLCQRYVAPA